MEYQYQPHKRHISRLISIHVVLPIFVGGMIYILFRTRSLLIFRWFNIVGISELINSIRDLFSSLYIYLPKWIIFSLPDGLWVYSFSASYLLLWGEDDKKGRYWVLLPLVMIILTEIMQYYKIIGGTFDVVDIIISIVAFVCSYVIILKPRFYMVRKRVHY